MKNKLFYLIGVTTLLSYTGTFTSCVNGVDDEYLEQKISEDNGGSQEGEEIPDINGDYGKGGDYDLVMTCNGEELTGKLISIEADETNETATLILAGAEVDLETAIASAIPGGVGGLISGMGLKYISNSPIPGEKEVTIPNVSLYKNGTTYKFEGESNQPTYSIAYKGTIEGDKMSIDLNYDLTNQKLAGKWYLAPKNIKVMQDNTTTLSPLWFDCDSEVEADLGVITINMFGRPTEQKIAGKLNGIINLLVGSFSPMVVQQIIPGAPAVGVEDIVGNMLEYVAAEPNGSMFASYSYSGDISQKGPYSQEMPHNVLRYYYDETDPAHRIYLEANVDFLVKTVVDLLATPSTRVDYDKTKEIGKRLIKLLVPVLQNGIPCEYTIDGDNLNINIDGVVLRDILRVLIELLNDEVVKGEVDNMLAGLGDFKENISLMLKTMPNALQYKTGSEADKNLAGECGYVKFGLKFVKK